jgi:hypothetical protein
MWIKIFLARKVYYPAVARGLFTALNSFQMIQLAGAFTICPKIDEVLPKSFRIIPKSSNLVSESFEVLPNLNKTSLFEQSFNSGDEMHIRQIYESFSVLEDIHRSGNERMDEISTLESLSSPEFSPPTTSSDDKTLVSTHLNDDAEFENLHYSVEKD